MKMVPLGEVISAAGGRAGADSPLPVYAVTKHAGFVPSLEYFKKQVFSRETKNYRSVQAGDFAYATIHLDEGSIGIAPEAALISPMYTVFRIDESQVDARYLIRLLKSPYALTAYSGMGRGAVHRRKSISLESLSSLQVHLPRLQEQRRIATILDQADGVNARAHGLLDRLEAVSSAVFFGMFCAQERPRALLGNLCTWRSGGTPARTEPENFGTGYPWYSSGELGPLVAEPAKEQITQRGLDSSAAKVIAPGNVLVGMYDTAALKSSIISSPATCNQAIAFSDLADDSVTPEFLYYAIQHQRTAILNRRRGIRQKNLNLSMIREIDVPSVTIQESREFSRRVAEVEAQRRKAAYRLRHLNALFASLQSRAFRGEL